jgi:thiamine biosynthesis lipoprotein
MAEGSVRFPALGSTALVVATDSEALPSAVVAVEETVEAFDRTCSRFRDDSELSVLNRAGGRGARVSPLLFEAVTKAVRAAELTDGDVDPSLGRALIALGYDRDFDQVLAGRGTGGPGASGPSGADAAPGTLSLQRVANWRTIRLSPRTQTIALAPGVTLDLGATAKALAADHAAAAAWAAAGCGVLVSLGGDIATAGPAPADGWRVRVTDDHRSGVEAPGQWIAIRTGGLATSSTTVRRWRVEGEAVHHLLDPVSGRPSRAGWRTVSVAAATCLDANIASTAAIIRGKPAIGWLEGWRLPSRLVSDAGTTVHLAGWPSDGDDLEGVGALGREVPA